MTEKRFYATGKRKSAIARIYMKEGTGVLQVNKRNFDDYFTRESLKMLIQQPLEMTGKSGRFDFTSTWKGAASPARRAPSNTASPRSLWNMTWN